MLIMCLVLSCVLVLFLVLRPFIVWAAKKKKNNKPYTETIITTLRNNNINITRTIISKTRANAKAIIVTKTILISKTVTLTRAKRISHTRRSLIFNFKKKVIHFSTCNKIPGKTPSKVHGCEKGCSFLCLQFIAQMDYIFFSSINSVNMCLNFVISFRSAW